MSHSVLIIDDEQEVAQALKIFLESHDFNVRLAYSGEEGIAAIQEAKPDVVLLDLTLPGVNGWQVLRQVRQIFPDLRIAILTGSVRDAELEERAKREGAIGVIVKPIQVEELLSKIIRFLGEK